MRRLSLCTGVIALSVFAMLCASFSQSLTWLGVLPGGNMSEAYAVSADGQVVVGVSLNSSNSTATAFRWTAATGMVSLGTLGGNRSYAHGVSADGSVVAGYSYDTANRVRAYRWANGVMEALSMPSDVRWSAAYGTSADGSVVVGQLSLGQGRLRAFRWSAETGAVSLPLPENATVSDAMAVSADGQVVVGAAGDLTRTYAVRWTPDGVEDISGGYSGIAFAVSADGRVVVGRSGTGTTVQAFRWAPETGHVLLGTLPGGSFSEARAVSADGSIIVGQASTETNEHVAVRWREGVGWEDLNLVYENLLTPESLLIAAYAISPDGRYIVGFGYNSLTDRGEAWLLDTVPEPASVAVLMGGLCALMWRRTTARKAIR